MEDKTTKNIISIGIRFGADMVKDIVEVLKKAGMAKYGSPEDYHEITEKKKTNQEDDKSK